MTVAICIPTIARRSNMLGHAITSVVQQTVPCQVSIEIDHSRHGAWDARNRAIRKALRWDDAEWIGFLDDDDYLLPHHVETLINLAEAEKADVAYSWFHVEGGTDPFPQHRGRMYDPADPHIFPIPYLVRSWALRQAMHLCGGFQRDDGAGQWEQQDRLMVDTLHEVTNGAFACTDQITWVWRHHATNTSGLPDR